MNCKDCLHYEVCNALDENGQCPIAGASYCGYYRDKSEWVHLPCKVGDTVYIASEFRGVVESKVRTLFLDSKGVEMIRTQYCDNPFSSWGKTVFLTKEEADKALAERRRE